MNKLILPILYVLLCMLVYACEKGRTEEALRRLQKNKISIPYERLVRVASNDHKKSADDKDFKLVVFIDSTECTSCAIKNMFYWESFLDSVKNKKIRSSFDIVFIFSPPKADNERIVYQMRYNDCLRDKVFVDTIGAFTTDNPHIPQEQMYHTFLLNKNDSVVLVGNPKTYPQIEKMLFRKLTEK